MALRWATCSTSERVNRNAPSRGFAAWQRSSTALMDLRTSPPQAVAMVPGTPSSQLRGRAERAFSMASARSTAICTSLGSTALNSKTVDRERRAP